MLTLALASASPTGLTDGEAQDMANAFARCAGVWDFVTEMQRSQGKPANAELAEGASRGAMSVGGWLLALQHNEQNPDNQKTVAAFLPVIEGRRSMSLVAMRAAAESDDAEWIKGQIEDCGGLLTHQEAMLNEIRRSYVE